MIPLIIRHSLNFILMLLFQVLIIKNLPLGMYVLPFPYILFVLLLPLNSSPILVLLLSFLFGLGLDFFYDTQGMHALCTSLIGFLRTYALNILSPREGYDTTFMPTVQFMGNLWFLSYAFSLTFIHHLVLFFVEVFSFSNAGLTLLRVLTSSIASFALIYIIQFLFFRIQNKIK